MRRFLILFALLTLRAEAAPMWHCQLVAGLVGDSEHFMYYGRDSWNGTGYLYCESGSQTVNRSVAVSFNSMEVGFGADQHARLDLEMEIYTQTNPARLQVRGMVADIDRANSVRWQITTGLTDVRVWVSSVSQKMAYPSLQRGTLFIRATGD